MSKIERFNKNYMIFKKFFGGAVAYKVAAAVTR